MSDGRARRTRCILSGLLNLYPSSFRGAVGEDLVETALLRWRDATAQRPFAGALAFWCSEGFRFALDGVAERSRAAGALARDEVGQATRQMRRSWAHQAVTIGTLALGIGAAATIFTVADVVVFRPLPYVDADALVLVHSRLGATELSSNSLPNVRDLQSSVRTLPWIAAAHDASPALSDGGRDAERVAALWVTAEYLPGLGGRVVTGRPFGTPDYAAGAERVALVSAALAERRWGAATGALNRAVRLDGIEYRVIGVVASTFRDPEPIESGALTDVWAPARESDGAFAGRDAYWFHVIARIADGVSTEAAQREVSAAGRRLAVAYPAANTVEGDSLDFVLHSLHDMTVGTARGRLLLLLGAVALLLALACANVAGLSLARGVVRAPELALRRALGASRARIATQLFAENLLAAVIAGAVGGLLGAAALRLLVAAAPAGVPRLHEIGLDVRALAALAAITLIVAAAFGLLPAVRVANTVQGSGARATSGRATQRLQFVLVAGEVALALVLVAGSALLLHSIARTLRVHPGFDAEDVYVVDVRPPYEVNSAAEEAAFHRALLDGTRTLSGVSRAALLLTVPGVARGAWTQVTADVARAADGAMEPSRAPVSGADPGDDFFPFNLVYGPALDVLGVTLRAGRMLTGYEGPGDPLVVVINESAARQFFPDDPRPIGRGLVLGSAAADAPLREVVGIVGDVLQHGPAHGPEPQIYLPYDQRPVGRLALLLELRPGGVVTGEMARRMVRDIAPDLPLDGFAALSARYALAGAEARFLASLLTVLAGMGLVLAAVGTFATMSHAVSLRMREVGIRVALGARRGGVLRLVLAQSLRVAAAGIAAGAVVALMCARFLEGYVFGIGARDPLTLLAAAAILAAAALLASLGPALRAASADPNEVLRSG